MGFGSTAKKIQTVADTAEQLYAKVNEVRQQVEEMRETVTNTEERVERLEGELAEQRALVAALAEEQGIDPESVVAEVDDEVEDVDVEPDAVDSADADEPAGAETP
ncbi:hypothetical protein HUG10_06275 [Halorarum halophilum]|uniref:Uncharacterized protein n=1 Tax=Halorarum halophilum TaxID=2743090 RepID=A0A7D5GWT0_9EURY|nr:DUF5798 family protein [Halobaculum halophilum]QLG27169.1 hypothetical protein HUG10_06275 [Halobaculum halophilum]